MIKTLYILLIYCLVFLPQHLKAQTLKEIYTKEEKALTNYMFKAQSRTNKGWKTRMRELDNTLRYIGVDAGNNESKAYQSAIWDIYLNPKSIAAADTNSWLPVGPSIKPASTRFYSSHALGRLNCVAFHPSDSNIIFIGVAQGGIWKTTDHGSNWTPLTDQLPILRINDIAIDPIHPDTMYASVGDYAYLGVGLAYDDRKRHTHYGLGVFKTMDGGATWQPTTLSTVQGDLDASLIRRVLIDPMNTQNLCAAGVNGVYTSDNGGLTWTKTRQDLIWDIEHDLHNPKVIWATTGYVATLNQGQTGIIKSTDFGKTWQTLNTLYNAATDAQRIEIGLSISDSNIAYAIACDLDRGFHSIIRTTDRGNNWTVQMDKSANLNILHWFEGVGETGGQGTYDLAILVHPTNPDIVYTGGVNAWGSTDGGATWDGVSFWYDVYGPSLHADQHFYAFNPLNKKYYVCNDGGLYATDSIQIGSWDDANNLANYNWPTSWEFISNNLQITSFYRVGTSARNNNYVIAGAQDNGTFYYNASKNEWLNVFGGDGMDCAIDPNDPEKIYGSSQFGNFNYSNNGGINAFDISVNGDNGAWTTPLQVNQINGMELTVAYGDVYTSTQGSFNWMQKSNFPIVPSFGYALPTSAFDRSDLQPNVMYVAKRLLHSQNEKSQLWVTLDEGVNWQNITAGLPDTLFFTDLELDQKNPARAWVSCGGLVGGNKIFKTEDFGNTWVNISGNLPNLPANTVVHDENSSTNGIYVGMDVGIYYMNDANGQWLAYQTELPNVIVSDLEIHQQSRKLYAATFGRGIWVNNLLDTNSNNVINPPVGINTIENPSFTIFPNPANNLVHLKLSNMGSGVKGSVVNVMGATVQEFDVNGDNVSLPTHSLANGVYYISLDLGQKRIVRKLVIDKN